MKNNTFDSLKMFLMFVFVVILITVFIILLVVSSDNKLIDSINEFTKNDTKVLYFSNDENYSEYPIELFDKYDIEYLYINSSNINNFEKKKIEKIVNNEYLHDLIVIYKDGNLVDSIINYSTENKLNDFLKKYDIIPDLIGNPNGIIQKTKELLFSDFLLLYVPYEYSESTDEQNKILAEIAKAYNINYNSVSAYLLSANQKEKLNSVLQISSVTDQIVILIKNKKIVGSIRGINTKNTYLNKLYEYKYISEIENYIIEIDYGQFNSILDSKEANVIVVTKDDCKYCETIMATLNKIIIDNDISINSININDFDSEISKSIENSLIEAGYKDGFTTPLTLITQSNKVIDYIIGPSNEEYFIDIFSENGIIK